MTIRSRIVLGVLWALSLVAVAQWKTQAQTSPQAQVVRLPTPALPGVEVRFMRAQGAGGAVTGSLVANIGGQWLPVKLTTVPDGNLPR